MDMEDLGYFIFMEEQEEEAKQENEEREALMPPVLLLSILTIAFRRVKTIFHRGLV